MSDGKELLAPDDHLMAKLRHCAKAVDAGKHYGFGQDIWQKIIDRIEQLQMPHTEVLRLAELDEGADTQAMLKALSKKIEAQRKRIAQLERDAREDARGVATEVRWQERQGEDYGSY